VAFCRCDKTLCADLCSGGVVEAVPVLAVDSDVSWCSVHAVNLHRTQSQLVDRRTDVGAFYRQTELLLQHSYNVQRHADVKLRLSHDRPPSAELYAELLCIYHTLAR